MKNFWHTFATIFGIMVLGLTAYSIVEAYNRDYHAKQVEAERRDSDVRLCRIHLGIDYDFGQRKMIMACAADIQADRPPHGAMRSTLAERAWKHCIPDLTPCERALTK